MSGLSILRRWVRISSRVGSTVAYHVVFATLILQLALPPAAFANPGQDSAQEQAQEPAQEAPVTPQGESIAQRVQGAISPQSRLALNAVERNIGFLISQNLIDKRDGSVTPLGQIRINRSAIHNPPGLAERALKMSAGHRDGLDTLNLELEGMRYVHEIVLPLGLKVQDTEWDDERAYVLLSDGSRHVIDVKSLTVLMHNTASPVFHLGDSKVLGHQVTRIQLVRRRVDPADRSARAQLSRLDRNPETLERAVRKADSSVVEQLRSNIESMELPPLHPDLKRSLVEALRASEQIPEGSPLENQVLNSLQLALIAENEQGESITVGLLTREYTDAMIAIQDSALLGMAHLSSPDSYRLSEEIGQMQDADLQAIVSATSNPEAMRTLYLEGLQESLSLIPPESLKGIRGYAGASLLKLAKAKAEGSLDTVVDRFSEEALHQDIEFFRTEFLSQIETAVSQRESRSGMGRFTAAMQDRLAQFDPVKRMNQVVTALRWPLIVSGSVAGVTATGAGLDYMVTHGQNVALAVDTLAATWAGVRDMTVLADLGYTRDMLTLSVPFRLAIMAAVFAAAAVARPFSQNGINKLITITGIKYLFSLPMMPPQRMMARLFNRTPLLNAMQRGYLPGRLLAPFMPEFVGARPLPVTEDSQPWYTRAVNWARGKVGLTPIAPEHAQQPVVLRAMNRVFESKQGWMANTNRHISERDRLRSLAGAVAIHAFAEKEGKDPFELLKALAGSLSAEAAPPGSATLKQRKELANLTLAVTDIIGSQHAQEVAQAFQSEPDAFVDTLARLRATGDSVATSGANVSPGLIPHLKLQGVRRGLIAAANFRESTYRQIANPMPTDVTANYVIRSFLVDGAFTIGISSFTGSWARLSEPNHLAYQPGFFSLPNEETGFPGSVGFTHPHTVINDLEQVFLHLGASAAIVYMSMSKSAEKIFQHSGPAGRMDWTRDHSQDAASNAWYRDTGTLAVELLNFRKNNPLDAFGRRSWLMCWTLLQGIFVVGMGLRLFEGIFSGELMPDISAAMGADPYFAEYAGKWKSALMDATMGQTFFIFMAPFVYRWFWAVHQSVTEGLENKIRNLGGKFEALHVQLTQSLEHKDLNKAREAAIQIIDLYDQKHRFISPELREKLKFKEGDDVLVWLNGVSEVCRTRAAVAERPNEWVNQGFTLVGAVITTMLATFLMTESFHKREFWGEPMEGGPMAEGMLGQVEGTARNFGVDPSTWNLWKGVSPHDSVPSIVGKSLATIYAMWVGGRLFPVVWDAGKIGYHAVADRVVGAQNRSDFGMDRQARDLRNRADLAESVEGLARITGYRTVFPLPAEEAQSKIIGAQCHQALEAYAQSSPPNSKHD